MLVLGKTWAKNPPPRQHQIVSIFKKRVVKQAIRGKVENSEIVAIHNQYKETLDDLIDSSDLELSDWAGPIDERSRNTPISKWSSTDLLEGNCLDKDLSDKLSRLAPKTQDSQVHQ